MSKLERGGYVSKASCIKDEAEPQKDEPCANEASLGPGVRRESTTTVLLIIPCMHKPFARSVTLSSSLTPWTQQQRQMAFGHSKEQNSSRRISVHNKWYIEWMCILLHESAVTGAACGNAAAAPARQRSSG